ncbi:MAG: hypothetical protein JWM58_2601 [Rhizobium sp.]|nr:hypothetical protein [Rhizobium sp.]
MLALREFQKHSPEEVAVIVEAVARAAEHWHITNIQAAALFDVPIATWNRIRAGQFRGILDHDKTMRASLIVGIFKGLRLLFNGPLQNDWPRLPNKGNPYLGQSPLDYMISGGIPAMMKVRMHIDALRSGM